MDLPLNRKRAGVYSYTFHWILCVTVLVLILRFVEILNQKTINLARKLNQMAKQRAQCRVNSMKIFANKDDLEIRLTAACLRKDSAPTLRPSTSTASDVDQEVPDLSMDTSEGRPSDASLIKMER